PLLGVYDTNGNLLLANDDLEGADTTDAGFAGLEIPRDLVLVLEVASVTGRETGSYVISVEAAAPAEPEDEAEEAATPEATAEPEEEATPAATEEPEEEATPAATPEATEEPEEEATPEATLE